MGPNNLALDATKAESKFSESFLKVRQPSIKPKTNLPRMVVDVACQNVTTLKCETRNECAFNNL